jgi:AcrR family transcriptional regulator
MTATAPTEAQIQAVADALLAEARADGSRPSVSALADRAGITRPTLYRNFPGVLARFRAETTTAQVSTVHGTPAQKLRDRITRLRTENEQLRLHLDLYEEHIRRLTIENTRLTAELVRRGRVTDLASRRDGGSGA